MIDVANIIKSLYNRVHNLVQASGGETVMARSYEDVIVDNLLLLYIISKSTNLGRTKLQKLVYLIETEFGKKDIKTFNYHFKRWHFGPFTKEILKDSESLVENHLVFDNNTRISNRGKEILEQTEEIFAENEHIINEIDGIVSKYDKLDLNDLKEVVYKSKVKINGNPMKVEDVSLGTYLKTKVSDEKAINKININTEWLETLDILFDSEFNDSVHKASEKAKVDQSYSYDEVFSDV